MSIPYSLTLRMAKPGKPNEENKTFPAAQYAQNLSMNDMAKHMASHGSKYNKGDIIAVATQLVDCIREQLLLGNRMNLGDLGTFYVSLRAEAADKPEPDTDPDDAPRGRRGKPGVKPYSYPLPQAFIGSCNTCLITPPAYDLLRRLKSIYTQSIYFLFLFLFVLYNNFVEKYVNKNTVALCKKTRGAVPSGSPSLRSI